MPPRIVGGGNEHWPVLTGSPEGHCTLSSDAHSVEDAFPFQWEVNKHSDQWSHFPRPDSKRQKLDLNLACQFLKTLLSALQFSEPTPSKGELLLLALTGESNLSFFGMLALRQRFPLHRGEKREWDSRSFRFSIWPFCTQFYGSSEIVGIGGDTQPQQLWPCAADLETPVFALTIHPINKGRQPCLSPALRWPQFRSSIAPSSAHLG